MDNAKSSISVKPLRPSLVHAFILLSCMVSLSSTSDELALFAFKSMLSDPTGALLSWNNQTIHFCQWRGVTCGMRQHRYRVTSLDLNFLDLTGSISPSLSNLSLLTRLHLAGNRLHGSIPEELGRLSRLRYLNLSYNALEGRIPVSLSNCTSLQNISLNGNFLRGEIPANLTYCSDLRVLCLDRNLLVGEIPGHFTSLRKLSWLYLSSNNLTGSVPSWLSSSSSLTRIDLSSNGFTGTVPPSLGNLSSLILLDLSQNNLIGGIPPSLGNCSLLIFLGLARNTFEGSIPEGLSYFPSLETLDISFNMLSGTVPSPLYNISSIRHLSVGINQLVGTLPVYIGHALPRLKNFVVQGNQFGGPIPLSLTNASTMAVLDLSRNKFSGSVPTNFGQLRNLYHLNLGWNQLEAMDVKGWSFLASLTNCTNLNHLILANNLFIGNLPSQLPNLSSQLQTLVLARNQISGSIPAGIENLTNLTRLNLNQNLLTGTIPASIGRLRAMGVLNLSKNRFSGVIPASVGNLTQLNELQLGENELQGRIPPSFGNLRNLGVLNLSYNQLDGTIPKEVVSITSLSQVLDLSYNSLEGSIPQEVGGLQNLVWFDVSCNRLSGEIPSGLGDCEILQYLYMENNSFWGPIPSQFSKLKGIQELDLSCNNLSGHIPRFLASIRSLQLLNLSFNNFEGEVPLDGIFGNASAISIEGNDKLCGSDLMLGLPVCSTQASKESLRIILITVSSVICLIALSLFAALYWKRSHSETRLLKSFSGNQYGRVSFAELCKATDGFSSKSLIGTGNFSSVHRATIEGYKREVAVKVFHLHRRGALESFEAECEALRNIRHRNIIKIETACSSIDPQGNDFKALVFEIMPNGSLEEWLHPKDCENGISRWLSLAQRLNIATGVAAALEYLHRHCEAPIVHCDLKPTNILLDNDMNAIVADFGLARFLDGRTPTRTQDSTHSIAIKGSVGYIAPEQGMGKEVSVQGDAYSYGILLLEMMTGKRPTDDMFKDGLTLHRFVEMAFPERIMEIMDPRMQLWDDDEEGADGALDETTARGRRDCLISMFRIGLSFSKETPSARMEMRSVASEMEALRTFYWNAMKRMR